MFSSDFKKNKKNIKLIRFQAFTLIELLVVIAIIGVLSAVVLTNLQNAREKARWTAILAYYDQVMTAMELYANDFGGSYIDAFAYAFSEHDIGDYGVEAWRDYLTDDGILKFDNVIYILDVLGYIDYDPDYARGIIRYVDNREAGYIDGASGEIAVLNIDLGDPYIEISVPACDLQHGNPPPPYVIYNLNSGAYLTDEIPDRFLEEDAFGRSYRRCLKPRIN